MYGKISVINRYHSHFFFLGETASHYMATSSKIYYISIMSMVQYRPKETPQLIGLFSWNLVATNCMQCFLYGPIGCN